MLKHVSLALFLLAACGGDDPASPDAPAGGSDAAVATVMAVACVGGEPEVLTDNAVNAYMPATTSVAVNQAVKFTNSSNHNVAPAATMSDRGLDVGFGATKCLKFTVAGTFRFRCSVPGHNFMGTVTVN